MDISSKAKVSRKRRICRGSSKYFCGGQRWKVNRPVVISNLDETTKTQRMDGGRERLAKFMFEISNGYTIMPYASVIDVEIYDAVLRRTGRKGLAINVIKKGISNLLGSKASIEGNISDAFKKKLEEVTDSPETILFLLSQRRPKEYMKRDDSLQRIVEIYEKGRKDVQKIPERYRYPIEMCKAFRDAIIPKSAPLMMALGIRGSHAKRQEKD